MLDGPASLQSVKYAGRTPKGPARSTTRLPLVEAAAAVMVGDPGQEHSQDHHPQEQRWAACQVFHTPTCLLSCPTGRCRPGSPANVLQRLRRTSIVIRCTPGLSSRSGHITERDPRAGEVTHRLNRLETLRGGPERLLGL